jgi:hypothetical protein
MAHLLHDIDPNALEEQLKMLGQDQLLDCWEDSQHMALYLEDNELTASPHPGRYEQAILYELQLRTIKKCAFLPHPGPSLGLLRDDSR